ncbi:MAG: hypothetical protein JWQ98_2975 [Chlorobi bacterium]|nr:hypothetical protein [Chlorobiota bacterium]
MAAGTIDEIIAELESIIRECIIANSRLGYFAALYNRVTLAIRDAVGEKQFDDNERMARLDVVFAGRYIDAYRQYKSGGTPTKSWLKAFRAAEGDGYIVLQHLFAGMNAHINLDLGIAAATVAPGAELAGLRADFDRINDILASLTPTVEGQLGNTSWEMNLLTSLAPGVERSMLGFGMTEARSVAWMLARELSALPQAAQQAHIALRDEEASLLADAILLDDFIVQELRRSENNTVADTIQLLCAGEFRTSPPLPAPGVPAPESGGI